jgi:hypothetical protein
LAFHLLIVCGRVIGHGYGMVNAGHNSVAVNRFDINPHGWHLLLRNQERSET